MWDATAELTLMNSLNLAGQVFSLDSWNDYVAVGSSVVQLIQLKPNSEPRRVLYAKGGDHIQVYMQHAVAMLFVYSSFVFM